MENNVCVIVGEKPSLRYSGEVCQRHTTNRREPTRFSAREKMLVGGHLLWAWNKDVGVDAQNVPPSRTLQKMKSEYLHVLPHGER